MARAPWGAWVPLHPAPPPQPWTASRGKCMSKTLRQFQCRDDLWARVDALAKRRGISTDDVVQAALLQLFKSKKKEGESSVVSPAPTAAAPAAAPAGARPAA